MALCKICFQETQGGVIIPGYQAAQGVVHQECLAAAVLKLAGDPQKEGLLRYLIEYEERQSPDTWTKDVSGGSADVSWRWSEVGVPATRIRMLLNAGLVSVIFSTNSTTCYSLVGRAVIKEALSVSADIPVVTASGLDLPDDLFECIIGYEDIKDEIRFTLKENKRNHYLLIGPPATAKSLFLMEIGHLRGAYAVIGSRVSGAGLNEVLFNYRPRLLLLDEIDKIPMDVIAALLSVMENGETLETKYKRERRLKLDLNVLAAGNSDKNIPSNWFF
jgi:hypothetical protein